MCRIHARSGSLRVEGNGSWLKVANRFGDDHTRTIQDRLDDGEFVLPWWMPAGTPPCSITVSYGDDGEENILVESGSETTDNGVFLREVTQVCSRFGLGEADLYADPRDGVRVRSQLEMDDVVEGVWDPVDPFADIR